ncbi:MAG: hypothetical protein F4076_01760 [Acidimicrobiaceae bacterium]|nr:hypothetical protein [Acidimicrobiaceae bacterium]MYE74920.1 hypothetical protein [Acidimicrobiaceae bacterium]MYJ41160.1 hypothetical protein [Acidimicrobiaceae bacterium]
MQPPVELADAPVAVNYQKETGGECVIVRRSGPWRETDGLDGIGVEGFARVRIEVTANVLECIERSTEGVVYEPLIEIHASGVVRDFVGVCGLGRLDGELICQRGERSERPARVTALGDSGGKLVGVDITQLRSPLHFERVRKLSVFSPDVESLYDSACSFDRLAAWLRRRQLSGPSQHQHQSTPREQAHWFRDLYEAMGSNAVPASTRAAVRWCYALLEHESIKPRRTPSRSTSTQRRRLFSREAVESIGRWLHRCVGYGQRPSRPLVCWLIATTGVTIWSAQHSAVDSGAAGWLQRGAEVLLSPLRVLRLGYGSTPELLGGPALDAIAYLVVGLPFLFFVVSLREFFRSPLSRRPSTL